VVTGYGKGQGLAMDSQSPAKALNMTNTPMKGGRDTEVASDSKAKAERQQSHAH